MSRQNALTYILVDFENLQPPDMGLLSGEQFHLRIFRGPHQNKLGFDIVESLQPHGNRVQHIQSDQHGPNALDFRIAFHMGRLIEALEANDSNTRENTRFVVISKDKGFDPLISHVRSLGYGAMKAESIRQALGLDEPVTEAGGASQPEQTQSASAPSVVSQPRVERPAAKKAAPIKQAVPAPKKTATALAKPANATEKKPQTPARKSLGLEDKEKILENLRQHPKKRPVKRQTLENHITSLLGGNVTAKAVRGLVAGLENEGIIKFNESKIDAYKIPKRKK